jgi:hypothetical protein
MIVACDSGDSNGDGPAVNGEYSVSVEGTVQLSSSGLAQFTDPNDSDQPGWRFTIELTEAAPVTWNNQEYYFETFISNPQLEQRPQTGTFDMVSYFAPGSVDTFSGEMSLSPVDGEGEYIRFEADDGTLTISDASSDRIEGTVEFTGIRRATGDEVTVSGTFTAQRALPTI